MPKITRKLAAELAKKLRPGHDWEKARDLIDRATYGELDAWQLDKLTDWAVEFADRPGKAA